MTDNSAFYLVSCVGKKHGRSMPAKELYVSEWFHRARAYVERQGCPWFILSAKLGLIEVGPEMHRGFVHQNPHQLRLNVGQI